MRSEYAKSGHTRTPVPRPDRHLRYVERLSLVQRLALWMKCGTETGSRTLEEGEDLPEVRRAAVPPAGELAASECHPLERQDCSDCSSFIIARS